MGQSPRQRALHSSHASAEHTPSLHATLRARPSTNPPKHTTHGPPPRPVLLLSLSVPSPGRLALSRLSERERLAGRAASASRRRGCSRTPNRTKRSNASALRLFVSSKQGRSSLVSMGTSTSVARVSRSVARRRVACSVETGRSSTPSQLAACLLHQRVACRKREAATVNTTSQGGSARAVEVCFCSDHSNEMAQ